MGRHRVGHSGAFWTIFVLLSSDLAPKTRQYLIYNEDCDFTSFVQPFRYSRARLQVINRKNNCCFCLFSLFWSSRALLSSIRLLFLLVVTHCLLLAPIACYWLLLAPIGSCWLLLVPIGSYWLPLAPIDLHSPANISPFSICE